MKRKLSTQILSMLLALVMVLGLLPVAAYASDYIKLGEIKAVTVQTKDLAVPVVGERKSTPRYTLISPTDQNVTLMECGWQKYNAYSDTWEYYSFTKFEKGTYRLQLLVTTMCSEDSRTYYALLNNTTLTVDGTRWTAEWMDDQYEATGFGEILFSSPGMEALPTFTVTDNCQQCSVVPVGGEMTVLKGNDFSFTLKPMDYYELTDPDGLMVFANDRRLTPDGNGVYTVKNATEDLEIYTVGSGFTAYADLTITANGVTVKEKVYAGQSYTLKTVAGYGATVPDNSSFTHWKVTGLGNYQPGQSFTVNGGGEIRIDAVFSGLHNITVVGGTAYADAAHTKPLSVATEDQVIYIVADEAPEGKVFGYWSHQEIASPGGSGWFGDYDSAETTYTVYYSDVVIAPVYETQIDEIVINGMTKPSVGVAIDNSDYSYKWGCSVPANSGYSLGINYWYDITTGEPVTMSNGDVFQIGHTYRFQAKITLYGDTIFPTNAEDISVSLDGIDSEDYQWTINEISYIYEYAVIYFEFTCEREMPGFSYERPVGYGTKSDPFRISTVGELYWFSAFVNKKVTASDLTIEPETACAILMNDITVNPSLLNTDGTLIGAYGFERWIPIGYYSKYSGTFEGQGYTISGLYFDHGIPYRKYRDIGFVANLDDGGCVRLLTIADSWFATPSAATDFYMGGIAGYVGDGSIVGCSFRGVIKANNDYYLNSVGGIAGVNNGTIDDCWVMGWVKAYSTYGAGGIAGSASGTVKNSLSYAEVINTLPTLTEGGSYSGTGGIVGVLREGTVQDCRNSGIVGGKHFVGGIAGQAYGIQSKQAIINRCYNDANVGGGGIVGRLGDSTPDSAAANGYATVKNCYNKGSVIYGICEYANGSGNSISYCHNVGVFTQQPILGGAAADSNLVVEHCYYKGDSERDSLGGTAYKTTEEFADGTVLGLMDNGNWKQGNGYPVLGEIQGVTMPTLTLKAPALEFKDMIKVIAFYTVDDMTSVTELGMITYTEKVDVIDINTAAYVIPGADYEESSGRYFSSSQGIHAKFLGDTVYLACYAKLTDGSYVYTKLAPYSPITYATNQLKNSTNTQLKQLVAAMLNYGAAAQNYFLYNTDVLANSTLTEEQKALPEAYRADMVASVPAADAAKQGEFANNKGFSLRKPAVSFEGAFSINYFFTPAYAPVDGITLYYWNEADFAAADVLTVDNASGAIAMDGEGMGQYRADIEGIAAKDLAKAVYVAAVYFDGTTTWTSGVLGYSIGAYCSSMASQGGTMAELAMATAVYGYHAKQYFG